MLLVLTHSTDATATYLCMRLEVAGIPFVRLNTDTCQRTVTITYVVGEPSLHIGCELRPEDVHAVWLRRPRPVDVGREGDNPQRAHVANEWGEAIEGFLAHIPAERWMNHPVANVGASHKLEQLTRAARLGFRVPSTLVTQDMAELNAFMDQHRGRIIAKPLASGYLAWPDGSSSSIYTTRVLENHLDATLLAACPTLFQAEIPKATDVRVTVVDAAMCAIEMSRTEAGAQIVDIRRDGMREVVYRPVEIPAEIAARLREIVASYGLRFAAIDFGITTDGEWTFFEVNPNGQWAWLDLLGATNLWQHFVHAFRHAA